MIMGIHYYQGMVFPQPLTMTFNYSLGYEKNIKTIFIIYRANPRQEYTEVLQNWQP